MHSGCGGAGIETAGGDQTDRPVPQRAGNAPSGLTVRQCNGHATGHDNLPMIPNLSSLQFAQTKPSTYHNMTDLWTATDALSLQVQQVNTAAPPNTAPAPATSSEVLRGDASLSRGLGADVGSLVFTLGDEVASRAHTRL